MDSELDKIDQQRAVYGEPVRDMARRVSQSLSLNQAAMARVLGLSPAMLSQLINGQRVKIGNPLVVSRLQSLLRLADEAPALTQRNVAARLGEIKDTSTSLLMLRDDGFSPARRAEAVHDLLRAVASGQELARAVEALRPLAPGLAEAIRVYGLGAPTEAERHMAVIADLA